MEDDLIRSMLPTSLSIPASWLIIKLAIDYLMEHFQGTTDTKEWLDASIPGLVNNLQHYKKLFFMRVSVPQSRRETICKSLHEVVSVSMETRNQIGKHSSERRKPVTEKSY